MQVIYDPDEVRYERLLDTFFQHVDPTTKNRQGNDAGTQYRSAIYYHNPEQRAAAAKVCPSAKSPRPSMIDKVTYQVNTSKPEVFAAQARLMAIGPPSAAFLQSCCTVLLHMQPGQIAPSIAIILV